MAIHLNRIFIALAISFILLIQAIAQNPLPKVVSGHIERIDPFKSKFVSSRIVDVWLPEGYSTKEKYAVLYMHDGQMLFDPEQSWNKQAWNIDDVATKLFQDKQTKKFIVVGIWNSGATRHSDYFPQKPFEQLTQVEKDTVVAQLNGITGMKDVFKAQSDDYLKFIVEELKPYIDRRYSVFTSGENTFIAGSSMGGLISMYAICEYPNIFGGAACLSTHWPGTFTMNNNPLPSAFLNYLDKNLPSAVNHRIYFDCGDKNLDALYPAIQAKADSIMMRKGYNSHHWTTRYFPGEDHSEKAWNERLHIPLSFLFKK